jgi:FKBP-type peptidyl-prolyl cis-trans isomerase (trigger factor)
MNIEITPKKSDGLERLIEVRVPIETVRDAEEKAARRYASGVRLPGFRPGKAPPATRSGGRSGNRSGTVLSSTTSRKSS